MHLRVFAGAVALALFASFSVAFSQADGEKPKGDQPPPEKAPAEKAPPPKSPAEKAEPESGSIDGPLGNKASAKEPMGKGPVGKEPLAKEPLGKEPLGKGPTGKGPGQPLALQARDVFKQFCHRCHHGDGSAGGTFDVLVDKTLREKSLEEKPYVVPGKPEESLIFLRVSKGEMPPGKIPERPSPADIEIIKAWIVAGAPGYPPRDVRRFIDIKMVLGAVLADISRAEPEDRPFLRYFTLTHLHNNPQVPDPDLDVYRAALSKALNSLSWKSRIVVPRPVDEARTVYAVDIRELDWDRNDLFQEVLKVYPYGLRFKDYPDPEVNKLDVDIASLAHCDLPLVRADWFVVTATRPPLYDKLLQLPKTAGELEKKLDVDVAGNFLNDKLVRAGFFPSGVSRQNRMVERHEGKHGAYWKSYDFKKDNKTLQLERFPLGPQFKENPFPDQAFAQDGGELIFDLPNGLQGYMLVNAKDERIEVGPIEVVSDDLKTAGTNEIVAGLSCMVCHKHGMIPLKDRIRDSAAVFGPALRKVQRLHPPAKVMGDILAEDEGRYLRALERAVGPFYRDEAHKGTPIKAFPEPIIQVARLYTFAPLNLPTVACELGFQGLDKPEELRFRVGDTRLKELGLGPILTGGAIDRTFWETGKGMSLMQRTARVFGATPFDVGP
jgi:mono/diheme cytochrome c family protein